MQNNKNFQKVLLDHINAIPDLGLHARLDYFKDDVDDLVVNSIPGGTIDKEYFDGTREISTPEETVLSVTGGYSFEGLYDSEDPAQALIAGMKYKSGDARRLWHRVTSADGKKRYTQIANASEIKAGAGDATEYEQFACTLKWIKEPKETAVSSV